MDTTHDMNNSFPSITLPEIAVFRACQTFLEATDDFVRTQRPFTGATVLALQNMGLAVKLHIEYLLSNGLFIE